MAVERDDLEAPGAAGGALAALPWPAWAAMLAVGVAVVAMNVRQTWRDSGELAIGVSAWGYGWPLRFYEEGQCNRILRVTSFRALAGDALVGLVLVSATGWTFARLFGRRCGRLSLAVRDLLLVMAAISAVGGLAAWGWALSVAGTRAAENVALACGALCCVNVVGCKSGLWAAARKAGRWVARSRVLVTLVAMLVWAALVVWPHQPPWPLPVAGWFEEGGYFGGYADVHYGAPLAWGVDCSCIVGPALWSIDTFAPLMLALDGLIWALAVLVVVRRRFWGPTAGQGAGERAGDGVAGGCPIGR